MPKRLNAVPAGSKPEDKAPLHVERKAGGDSKPALTLWRSDNVAASAWCQTPIPLSSSS